MKKSVNVKKIVLSAVFMAAAIILQLIGRTFVEVNPLLIGPLINTVILLTTYICGLTCGILISILTPVAAALLGALSPMLVPFVPFIIIGNIVFSVVFATFMKKKKIGLYLGVVLSSIAKFLFLSFSATKLVYMINLKISEKSLKMIAAAFTTPQLVTALLGGVIAIIILKLLEKRKIALPNQLH